MPAVEPARRVLRASESAPALQSSAALHKKGMYSGDQVGPLPPRLHPPNPSPNSYPHPILALTPNPNPNPNPDPNPNPNPNPYPSPNPHQVGRASVADLRRDLEAQRQYSNPNPDPDPYPNPNLTLT